MLLRHPSLGSLLRHESILYPRLSGCGILSLEGPGGGRTSKRVRFMERYWMPNAKLRALAEAGWRLEDIAMENQRVMGWRPDKGTVSRRLTALGIKRRHGSRRDLVPWDIATPHTRSRFRAMLQAESRYRAGHELSRTDQKLRSMLNDLLFGRGIPLVIGYDPRIGFYLSDRRDTDTDIIRINGCHECEN